MSYPHGEFSNLATSTQTPTEVKGWLDASKEYGLALVFLVLILVVLWRMARWIRPKADQVVAGILANNERVPGLIESQEKQNAAVLLAMQALATQLQTQSALLEQLAQRIANNIDRTQLVATHMSNLTEKMADLIDRLPRPRP